MPIYTCPKLRSGELVFEVDWVNQRLALRGDYVGGKETGASYNRDWVSFDAINAKLNNNPANSAAFADCFTKPHSSDNPTMLCAVLLNMGCIDKNYSKVALLTPDLQNSYDKNNPPINPQKG